MDIIVSDNLRERDVSPLLKNHEIRQIKMYCKDNKKKIIFTIYENKVVIVLNDLRL